MISDERSLAPQGDRAPDDSATAALVLDAERLRAVRATGLTNGKSPVLDGLARTVVQLLDVPIAFVTLVEELRQFMPGSAGAESRLPDPRSIPISQSICRHGLATTAPLIIDDAATHPLTAGTPSVTELGVRAYLGIPIDDRQGHVLGALCAMDVVPRAWSERDVAQLLDLAPAARAELLRAAMEQRYHLAIEATGEVIYAINPASGFVWREGALLPIFGRTAIEIEAEVDGWARCVHPDDRARAVASWETALASRAPSWECEYRLVHPDGREVMVRDRAGITRDDEGKPRQIAGVIADVTAERAAEVELRASEARMKTVLDTIHDGVVLQDRADSILLSNPAATRILGLTEDQLHGRSSYDPEWRALKDDGTPFGPEEHPSVVALRTNQPQTGVEMEVARPDGSRVWISIDSQPVPALDDRIPQAVLTTFRDVTRERDALRAAAHLAAIVSSSGFPIISTSPDGTIRSWNRSAERFFGLGEGMMVRRSIWDVVPEAHRAREATAHERALHGEVQEVETERVRHDGVHAPVALTISPVFAASGTVIGLATIMRDLTATRELEVELRQAQKLEAMGRLAGGVAHDFNNLLTAISGNAELLRLALPNDPQAHDDLEEIIRTVERAAALTRQLLTFSRKQVVRVRPLRVNATVAGATSMLRRIIGEDLRIKLELSSGEPVIVADPGQVEQVLLNLAVNARDAMPDGGELFIHTEEFGARRRPPGAPHAPVFQGPSVVISVRDTGSGMDEATRLNAFEPFFTTKPEGKGTGLGLSTVYGIAVQAGGIAWITSAPGAGTTVSVAIPAAILSGGSEELAAEGDVVAPVGHGVILLVEDDPRVLDTTARLLSRAGYHVLRAASPDVGIRRLEEATNEGTPVDAVVTDLVMPGGGGSSLLAYLGKRHPGLPVLVVSGYPGDESWNATDAPGTRFLPKPFNVNALLAAVRELLT